MQYNVIFSDRADDTFNSIGQQLEERFGERELNEFRRRVYEVVVNISKFPYIFKAVGYEENLRKAFIHRNCSMFYDVGETSIEILFFWDNRQDPIL
jgi:plasmid stabilization system protein ParE